jgi:hypothetical protein
LLPTPTRNRREQQTKAAVDSSQGGLFRSGRETLFLIDGFRLHRLTDDPARLGGPTIQRAALVQQWLAVRVLGRLVIEARCDLGIGEPAASDVSPRCGADRVA